MDFTWTYETTHQEPRRRESLEDHCELLLRHQIGGLLRVERSISFGSSTGRGFALKRYSSAERRTYSRAPRHSFASSAPSPTESLADVLPALHREHLPSRTPWVRRSPGGHPHGTSSTLNKLFPLLELATTDEPMIKEFDRQQLLGDHCKHRYSELQHRHHCQVAVVLPVIDPCQFLSLVRNAAFRECTVALATIVSACQMSVSVDSIWHAMAVPRTIQLVNFHPWWKVGSAFFLVRACLPCSASPVRPVGLARVKKLQMGTMDED
ncbi:hypothetical protein MRX96_021865 [Rhipicephalus microplus]